MNARYPLVSQRAGHRCEYCHAPEAIFNFPFEVEHVIPPGNQGPDDDANLALACRACNLHKADHVTGVNGLTNSEIKLFHPRQDAWEDHFQVHAETGLIEGKTALGRATVMRLRMNSTIQLEARRQWMKLGLFP